MRIDALNTAKPNLADKHNLGYRPPQLIEHRWPWIPVHKNLADEHTLADGPLSELRIDALNTATPNLADEPILADRPPN